MEIELVQQEWVREQEEPRDIVRDILPRVVLTRFGAADLVRVSAADLVSGADGAAAGAEDSVPDMVMVPFTQGLIIPRHLLSNRTWMPFRMRRGILKTPLRASGKGLLNWKPRKQNNCPRPLAPG